MNSMRIFRPGLCFVCGVLTLGTATIGCQSVPDAAGLDDSAAEILGVLPAAEDSPRGASFRSISQNATPGVTTLSRKAITPSVYPYATPPDMAARKSGRPSFDNRGRVTLSDYSSAPRAVRTPKSGDSSPDSNGLGSQSRQGIVQTSRQVESEKKTEDDSPEPPRGDVLPNALPQEQKATDDSEVTLSTPDLAVGTLEREWPIDLPTVLRLGNGSNLQVALARERIRLAKARVGAANALWLPSLTAGATYVHHTDMIQRANGEVFSADRNSFFLGGGPTANVDLADAFYEPLVQKQLLRADAAGALAVRNDVLLKISDAYLELLAAHASLEIAREVQANAAELARLTHEQARGGVGLKSDAERARTELGLREQQVILAQERITLASAQLAQLLHLDPQLRLVPAESDVVPFELIDGKEGLPQLVAQALRHRPELAEHQALLCAAVQKLNQATCGPLLPSLVVTYSRGRFGGGPQDKFDHWGDRDDFTVGPVWELRNLGLGDLAARRARESEVSIAKLRSLQVADRVATEVVMTHQIVQSRDRQISVAAKTVESARKSYEQNLTRIRGGAGLPIEVLQSIQALERTESDYLLAVTNYNKAQFRLLAALGNTPYSREIPSRQPTAEHLLPVPLPPN